MTDKGTGTALGEVLCPFKRIVVMGTTGAGKSILAQRLSVSLGYPHIEGDSLIWLPNWQMRSRDEFRTLVKNSIARENWVFDGCYDDETMKIIWKNADLVIWLDSPRWRVHWQVFRRAINNLLHAKVYSNGNSDSFTGLFLSRKSILLYSLLNYSAHRKSFLELVKKLKSQDICVLQFAKPMPIALVLSQILGASRSKLTR